jgi:hypothetical protein
MKRQKITIRTGLQWYRPTPDDYDAERRAARGFDDMLGRVGSQGSATDDEKKFGEQ